MKSSDRVFVDTGAWVALAVATDPLHRRAVDEWKVLVGRGSRLVSSVPVVLETFTFLDRRTSHATAMTWRESLSRVKRFDILACEPADLEAAWPWLDDPAFHRLSLVDATSFALMRRLRIQRAWTYDTHFLQAGFRIAP